MIIGVDLEKDERVLYDAYNDSAGVTARFNLNVLVRINRELGGNFDLSAFTHRSIYNRDRHRIEMHLISRKAQSVRVLGHNFSFRPGESIHTENSYKYSLERFTALARGSGWRCGNPGPTGRRCSRFTRWSRIDAGARQGHSVAYLHEFRAADGLNETRDRRLCAVGHARAPIFANH